MACWTFDTSLSAILQTYTVAFGIIGTQILATEVSSNKNLAKLSVVDTAGNKMHQIVAKEADLIWLSFATNLAELHSSS